MHQYFKIYKPFQVLSQFSPEGDKQTLSNFFKVPKDVYPVGRLDFDSEGLLLLTNNKQINHRLLHPNFQHQRSYLVQVDGAITDEAIAQLKKGVEINVDGKTHRCKPLFAKRLEEDPELPARNPPIRFRKEIPAPWLELILTEGKNRQVRKMTAKVGFPTLRLVRKSIEGIFLDKMQPGEMIPLSEQEIREKLFGGKSL
ncbi:MAG: pseudouridine synthase [Bacteroidetes bacterium 24-39-8]|nr:MAG: pseudouridine synthase [Sphingobacteriia bacterium 35-40-8]OYZ50976.1 MAG: pseudouridine synthase [Bacteroidetes bacterium 24-39-8]OZA68056.1 MAG: pseudouridine synthase [Sphingobacteriia bacterium 39-39-8]HQR92528.1 pseudouridine synthase [Sediminibacterium sp.]HQS56132.1 pseudouridine synthase [Sediminibacterium sp.]